MVSGLEHLLAEGIVSEVVGRLKSGKEADVYAVRFGGRVVAAKVYKERAHRSFKNNAVYQEGRSVRNTRSQRAMDRKTSFGQAAAEDAWKTAEADTLYKLHAADVRVPTPVLFLEGVLLMELVLGVDGEVAPRLIDTTLTPQEANAAYHDMLRQLARILSCDLIHGDLSPYNVLWGARGPTIIDFPQTISASHSSNAEAFFLRDARNVLGHLAAIDRSLQVRAGDAMEIWRAYVRRELTPDFLPVGRPTHSAPRPRAGVPHGPRLASPTSPQSRGPRDARVATGGFGGPPRPPNVALQKSPSASTEGGGGRRGNDHSRVDIRSGARKPDGPSQRAPQAPARRGGQLPEVIVRVVRTPRPGAAQPGRDERPTSLSEEDPPRGFGPNRSRSRG